MKVDTTIWKQRGANLRKQKLELMSISQIQFWPEILHNAHSRFGHAIAIHPAVRSTPRIRESCLRQKAVVTKSEVAHPPNNIIRSPLLLCFLRHDYTKYVISSNQRIVSIEGMQSEIHA